MNPLKSLMARALVALCMAVAVNAAAAGWRVIEAGGKTYYVDQTEFDGLKAGSGQASVFAKMDQATVVAGTKLQKIGDNAYELVLPSNKIPAKVVAAKTPAKVKPGPVVNDPAKKKTTTGGGTGNAGNTVPKGVDPEAWALVQNHPQFKGLNLKSRTAAAERLSQFKKANPEVWGKLLSSGGEAKQKAAYEIVQAPATEDKQIVLDRVTVALGGKPKADVVPVTAAPVKVGESEADKERERKAGQEDPILLLNGFISGNAQARGDIEARLARFMLRTGANAFVDPAYIASPDGKAAKIEERLKATAKAWLDQRVKDSKTDGASELVYCVGFDKGVPDWAQPHPTLEILASSDRLYPKMLDEGMKGWTVGTAKASTDAKGRVAPGAYAGAPVKLEDWIFAFFEAAAGHAHSAYADPRHKKKLAGDIADRSGNDNSVAPGGTRRGPKASGATNFGVKDMFEDGAVVGNVVVNKGGGYRRISLKIMTRRDPATGKMIDELGVFDISEPGDARTPSNIYGQRFPLNQNGESVFRLDDYSKDALKYKLVIKSGKITFGTPDGNSMISTSHDELFKRREDQVRSSKVVREIGGQSFRVIPQGGAYGTHLYFAIDADGKLIDGGRTPSNLAGLNQINSASGFAENLAPPQTAIGFIGKPNADKSNFYYQVWNDELKMFVPAPCKKGSEDMPCEFKAPPKPATTATNNNVAGTTNGEVQPGTTNPTTTNPNPDPNNGNGEVQPGPNVNGETAGTEAGLKACLLQEADFGSNLKRVPDTGSGFTMFLTKKDGNAFQLCVNNRQSVFVQGIPIWGKARLDSKNLIVEAVYAKKQVPAEEVVSGRVAGPEYQVPGRPTYELSSRFMHYVELSKITPDAINASGGGNGTVYMDQTAWVTFGIDPRKPQEVRVMQVRVKDDDAAKAEELVRRGFGIGSVPQTSFGKKEDVDVIVSFIKSEIVKYKGQNKPNIKNPSIFIELWVKKDAQELDPATVVTINLAGRKTGRDPKGEDIIDAEPYDELLYCYQQRKLESRKAHNAHLQGSK